MRKRGVKLPFFKGENGITWEETYERYDYYGRNGLDFDYSTVETRNGLEVNIIQWDDDDDTMKANENRFLNWVDEIAA